MSDEWQAVSELPPLGSGELQIWRTDLGDAAAGPDLYLQNLSPAERARAARHRAGSVRMRFVAARACLRVLLGNLMDLQPCDVPITLSAYGKPELPPEDQGPIFFSIAHSRETVLIALCREGRVGVDLEYLDRQTDAVEIARRSFHQNEFHEIEAIEDPAARQAAFFRCWTRKEAVIKADGRGLSLALDSFQVPVLGAPVPAPVLIAGVGEAPPQTWFVSDIALGPEIAGAFAAGLPGLDRRSFRLALETLPHGGSKT